MKPEEWIELAQKFIHEQATEEEVNQLRTNFTIWRNAHDLIVEEETSKLRNRIKAKLKYRVLTGEEWENLNKGIFNEDWSEEVTEQIIQEREEFGNFLMLQAHAKMKIRFFQQYTKAYELEHQEGPIEVQEMIWKNKAEMLEKAIRQHRSAYVLANKQPNGIDFALWASVGEDEFHASRSMAITLKQK